MSINSAFGQSSPLPTVPLNDVYLIHSSQFKEHFNASDPNQHLWTTSNGWIGVASYTPAEPFSPASISFKSILKAVGHNLVKALPTIIEIGMEVLPEVLAASTRVETSPKNRYVVTFRPKLNNGSEFGPVSLHVTPASVSSKFEDANPKASGEYPSLTNDQHALLKSIREIGAGAIRQFSALAGTIDDEKFHDLIAASMTQVLPNILSNALTSTASVA